MQVNFTLKVEDEYFDMSMDDVQKIHMALDALVEAGKILITEDIDFYYSVMKGSLISAYFSLKEAKIVDGDKLIAVYGGKISDGRNV